MLIGDGSTATFWHNWCLDGKAIREVAAEFFVLIPKHARKNRTVREALQDRCWITDISLAVRPVVGGGP